MQGADGDAVAVVSRGGPVGLEGEPCSGRPRRFRGTFISCAEFERIRARDNIGPYREDYLDQGGTMEKYRPSVFIGSSYEARDVARAVENHLQRETDATKWFDVNTTSGMTVIEWLIGAVWSYDFAVMILSPDDLGTSRNETFEISRDNVIFELGLFMGRLGRNRTFIVQDARLRLPSDLGAVHTFRYEKQSNMTTAVSVACNHIIEQIESQGPFRGISMDHDESSLAEKVAKLRMILHERKFSPDLIMGVSRGGLAVAALLSKQIGGAPRVPTMSLSAYPGFNNAFNRIAFRRETFVKGVGEIQILIVDDVFRQGKTLNDASSYVRESVNFPDVQIATAALTCYDRARRFDPTFIVESLGEPIERFGGDVEPFES